LSIQRSVGFKSTKFCRSSAAWASNRLNFIDPARGGASNRLLARKIPAGNQPAFALLEGGNEWLTLAIPRSGKGAQRV
jgi:hypothetical protein